MHILKNNSEIINRKNKFIKCNNMLDKSMPAFSNVVGIVIVVPSRRLLCNDTPCASSTFLALFSFQTLTNALQFNSTSDFGDIIFFLIIF